MPARAKAIWQERPDLQAAFDLDTGHGREGLVWWYIRHGFPEFGLKFSGDDDVCAQTINQPLAGTRQLSFLPITWLMRGLMDRVPLNRKALRSPIGQERLLCWFFAKGLMEANLAGFLTARQAQILLSPNQNFPDVPLLMACIWSSAPNLHERFHGLKDPAFYRWCTAEGAREFPILAHPLIALAQRPIRLSHRLKPFGINLFGHAHGRSGISEDVRMAAKVLAEANIPFAIHNVAAGPGMPDEEDACLSKERLPYAINMFTMTAEATIAAILKMGPADIGDCYNIGFWPWEMPEVPEFWQHAFHLVDEVWASSRFTYDAFCRSSPIPVRHMPFAVLAEETDGVGRSAFGLPSDRFLFGFAFDGLSSFARKAPFAVIDAFQKAFPRDCDSPGLVLKGLRTSGHAEWPHILNAVRGDDRIHLITESLSRCRLLDLWRILDCFVSLHRSEGFGRNIAETMLLGKPVIVTGHSGNMDYTNGDTAALVPCKLRPARDGEYPYCTGQLWAEPDLDAAAAHMQKMIMDAAWRARLATAGRNEIEKLYSPAIVGRRWNKALKKIYETGRSG